MDESLKLLIKDIFIYIKNNFNKIIYIIIIYNNMSAKPNTEDKTYGDVVYLIILIYVKS
jgi:hypothetical protein